MQNTKMKYIQRLTKYENSIKRTLISFIYFQILLIIIYQELQITNIYTLNIISTLLMIPANHIMTKKGL